MKLSLHIGEFAATVIWYIVGFFSLMNYCSPWNTPGLIKQGREQGSIHLHSCRLPSPMCKENSVLFQQKAILYQLIGLMLIGLIKTIGKGRVSSLLIITSGYRPKGKSSVLLKFSFLILLPSLSYSELDKKLGVSISECFTWSCLSVAYH